MSVQCKLDGSCPFLYECNVPTNTCEHLSVFPLTTYPLIIYSLFPFCSALCNLSGNSFGEYKVLMLMDLLNYQANDATVIAYPLITGTALYNFFNLIPKRHPSKNTSLIDYNIVIVLIPNILFGSTIGALINKFMPPIVSDALILPIMIGYSLKFFLRYREFKKQEKQSDSEENVIDQNRATQLSNYKEIESIRRSLQTKNISLYNEQQLQKVQQYESGLHLFHVFLTIGIFIVFEALSFLVQGKIIRFSICSEYYPIGMSIFTILFLAFDLLMYRYTKKKMEYFKEIGYKYDGKLDKVKNYMIVCLGGFLGGFNGGVFGIGSSTTMIFTLLYMKIQPAVVSATVGYQVVFSGLASLIQAFATGQIEYNAAGFFLAETFVLGGVFTYFARKILSRYNPIKVKQVLMLLVGSLVTTSSCALVASIIIGYLEFGAANMISIPFSC